MPTGKLEKIANKFKLRIFEIVPGMQGKILRFDFSAKDDSGQAIVAGSCAQNFKENESPREVANNLREMADALDKYWARTFPPALDTDKTNEQRKEL